MTPAIPFVVTTVLFGVTTILLAAREYRRHLQRKWDSRPLKLPRLRKKKK